MVLVEPHVIKGAGVGGPDRLALGVGNAIGKIRARGEIANAQCVEFRALFVGAPGQQGVIGRWLGVADLEEFLAAGERVAVKHYLFLAAPARLAADQFVLAALAIPVIGFEGPRTHGNVRVILLHARPHFLDQRAAKIARGR